MRESAFDTPAHYRITVQGCLDPAWSSWFDGFAIAAEGDSLSHLLGTVTDQAALHGVLAKIRDLGLPLVALERVSDGPEPARFRTAYHDESMR